MCEFLAFLMVLFGCEICDPSGSAELTVSQAGGNAINIELVNEYPVRGVQFTITPCEVVSIETTERTEGFFAKVNKNTGTVVIVSLSGCKINPGVGSIALIELAGSGFSCYISDIKISE